MVLRDNWVEVADFSQDRAFFGNTNSFTIEYSDWRINWEFEKTLGDLTAFMFEVRTAETNQLIDNWNNSGKIDITKGILNISGYEGEFYLWIGTIGNHTVIVEQNTDSVSNLESNWVEVLNINRSGGASFNSGRFTIDYPEWQIRWEFDPGHWHFADLHFLNITVYEEEESVHFNYQHLWKRKSK